MPETVYRILQIKASFFNKYIHNLPFVSPLDEDFKAYFDGVPSHRFENLRDVEIFFEAFEAMLTKHEIDLRHIDNLLYFSFYINEERDRLANMDSHFKNITEVLDQLIELNKQPFTNGKVKISNLEFSKDVNIFLKSKIDSSLPTMKIRKKYVEKMVVALTEQLLEELKGQSPILCKRVLNCGNDLNDLELAKKLLTQNNRTNMVMTNVCKLMLPYLSEECGLTKLKAAHISHQQSAFLFDYFVLFDLLPKMKDYETCENVVMNRRGFNKNQYLIKIAAQRRSYAYPTNHIRETFMDNLLITNELKTERFYFPNGGSLLC